tara:strand:- start:958 stop:1851 length:894 start_codon:yes stop_codon:yes gene_type:complete
MAIKKLGIIGISEGNGHPYSWSAIINGYDKKKMQNCGFPVIPRYLAEHNVPSSEFKKIKVSSVYSQCLSKSVQIAETCKISHISESLEELNTASDAVLLARDDAENHLINAEIFLRDGKPIYIDKPIALNIKDLEKLYHLSCHDKQIFSCSALRFAQELYPTKYELSEIGNLEKIYAITPNSWEKYAVHVIDPLLHFLNFEEVKSTVSEKNQKGQHLLRVTWANGLISEIRNLGSEVDKISLEYIGSKGSVKKLFSDPYRAFKKALLVFLNVNKDKSNNSNYEVSRQTVSLIEEGLK